MANLITNNLKSQLLQSFFGSGTFKVMLLDSNHSTNIDTQDNIDDVSANEITGTGYTAGGETLASISISADDTDDEGVVDAANVTWNGDITASYAAVYKDSGTPSTSTLVGILDFGAVKTSSNGDFTIDWDAEGVFNLN